MAIHNECLDQVIRWCNPAYEQVSRERLEWERRNARPMPHDRYEAGILRGLEMARDELDDSGDSYSRLTALIARHKEGK